MKKMLYFLALLISPAAFAQSLNWAYSFTNTVVLEQVDDISGDGNNHFAIIGSGNTGISMDPINGDPAFNSPGGFLAVYNAQPAIQWIKPTIGFASGLKMTTNGDVYVCGKFSGTVDFDPSAGEYFLSSSGGDAYLQKFDGSGNFQWAINASTDGYTSEIGVLPNGDILVAGRSDIDAVVTLSDQSTVNLPKGLYLLVFSPSGSFINAFSISVPAPAAYMYVYDLTVDNNSNCYLSGTLDGVADFDLGTGEVNTAQTNGYDAYVVKYNSSFGLEWFKLFGDTNTPVGWDKARSVSVDASGNVYAVGEFTWTTDFDPVNPGNFALQSDDNSQVPSGFILQWTPSGNLNWVKKIGNNNTTGDSDYASVSILDTYLDGNSLFVAMEGFGYVDVDPSENEVILHDGSAAYTGIIFGKYSLSGDYQAAFQISGPNSSVITKGFEKLQQASFATTGTFQKIVDFDPSDETHLLETDINGMFYDFDKDIFIARYTFGDPSAINEPTNNQQVMIYPNPFQQYLSVNNQSQQHIQVMNLYDLQGRLVLTSEYANSLQIPDVQVGVYTLEIIFDDLSIVRKKVIKQHTGF
ncbi:MAG: T9SS type A sorting domain-containing protein [Bacteroidetes bacterium]|nr:T9SS type A sorting domain-containing protein [Bacteroidota bacterium]